MINVLSRNLISLAQACPYPLYVVGGRTRDFLAGLKSERADTDICAPTSAEDFAARASAVGFKADAVYSNTGTVKISRGDETYEFACFRSDEYVRGAHKPVMTFYTDDIGADARRRDFKCNAVYYDISAGEFVDPLGGIADIKARRLTTVREADRVFGEDGLRLMRLARIAAETGFTPDEECLSGALKNSALIRDVAIERIYSELNDILHADNKYGIIGAQYSGLEILKDIGVFREILPELALGENMLQPAAFHDYDVLEHSLRAVKYADSSIRLAALLHDVGKPFCKLRDGNYHYHDKEGARIALEICTQFKVPRKLTERVCTLISLHMYDLKGEAKENKVRKFIVRNYEYFDELMLLKQADFSACKDNLAVAPTVSKMKGILDKMISEKVPLTLKELAVRGNELISAGIRPERTGEALNKLLEACAMGCVKNDRDDLVKYALTVANCE